MDEFIAGNVTTEALLLWCDFHGCKMLCRPTPQNNSYTISFDYSGKKYVVKSNKNIKSDSTPSVIPNSNKNSSTEELFEEYKNNLVLANFLRNNLEGANGERNVAALYETSDGKTLTESNYLRYINEIDNFTGSNIENLKVAALNKFVHQFATGEIKYGQIDAILEAIGITDSVINTLPNGIVVVTFTYDDKSYRISSNAPLVSSQDRLKNIQRKNYATNQLNQYLFKLNQNGSNAKDIFTSRVSNTVTEFIEGFITEEVFIKTLEKNFVNILREIGKAQRVQDVTVLYEEYTPKLSSHEGAFEEFQTRTATIVEKFIAGNVRHFELVHTFKTEYANVIDLFERKDYSKKEVEAKRNALAKYNYDLQKFEEEASKITDNFVDGRDNYDTFDKNLEELFNTTESTFKRYQREDVANKKIAACQRRLKGYDIEPQAFLDKIDSTLNAYINGEIEENEFKSYLDTVVSKFVAEARQLERKEEAKSLVNSYKTKLAKYKGEYAKFEANTKDVVNQYIAGKLNAQQIKNKLQTEYVARVKAGEATLKTQRENYANNKIKDYKGKLAKYSGEGAKFEANTKDAVNQYVEGKLAQKDLDTKLQTEYETRVKAGEATLRTQRENYANNKIKDYKGKLVKYSGEGAKFEANTKDAINQYVEGKLAQKDLDTKLQTEYNARVKAGEEALALKAKQERQNYANNKIKDYKGKLAKYSGEGAKFEANTKDAVSQYVEGKLAQKDLDTKLQTEYNARVKAGEEALALKAKQERQDYATKQIKAYTDKFNGLEDAIKLFEGKIADSKKQYIEGKLDKTKFDQALEKAYTETEKEIPELKAEAEKAERRAYCDEKIDHYTSFKNMAKYVTKYKNAVAPYVERYINGEISKEFINNVFDAEYCYCLGASKVTTTRKSAENKKSYYKTYFKNMDSKYYEKFFAEVELELYKYANAAHLPGDLSEKDLDKLLKTTAEKVVKEANNGIDLNKADDTKKKTTKNSDGTYTIETYNANGKILNKTKYTAKWVPISSEQTRYHANGHVKQKANYTYNSAGKTKEAKVYNYNEVGATTDSYKYTYEYDSKNTLSKKTGYFYNAKGNVTTRKIYEYNTDRSYSVSTYTYSTRSSVKKQYKADGTDITKTGYSQIAKGKVTKSAYGYSATMTTRQLYNAITSNLDNNLLNFGGLVGSVTAREVIKQLAVGSYSDDIVCLTERYLEAAQPGKTLKGATSTYASLDKTGYKDVIYSALYDALYKNYGYLPTDIKGYYCNSSSATAKAMTKCIEDTNNSKVKQLVKDIKNGTAKFPYGIQFSSDDDVDLYYSINNCSVLSASISGTTLTMKVFDIYDFDQDYITQLNKATTYSGSLILNAAGAAAMKDGKLVPYYHITDVKINLKNIFSSSELKSLGIQ